MFVKKKINGFDYLKENSKDVFDLSLRVLNSNNLEWNFNMIKDYKINIFEHLKVIIGSNNLYWNIKCVTYFVENKDMDKELAKYYATLCADVIYKSNNEQFISFLNDYLSEEPLYKSYVRIRNNK